MYRMGAANIGVRTPADNNAAEPKGKGPMNSPNTTTATAAKTTAPTNIATEATTAPSRSFTSFILAQLNCAALRSKIITNEIEATATAL